MRYIERYRPKEGEGHNRILIVTGVSGSGKDFLLSEAARQSHIPDTVRTFSFGQVLFDYLRTIHPQIQTRDDIRTLLNQDEVRNGILGVIDALIQAQPVTLNTHVVYRQRESYTINADIDKRIHPVGYVYVWSEPDQIAEWRIQATTRTRPAESVDAIALHQELGLEIVSVLARYTGASLKTIWNRADNVTENLETIEERVRELIL